MRTRPPIAFFAFNRPDHAARSLAALGRCTGASESDLIVHVDGPRSAGEQTVCDQVAAIAGAARGFRSVSVVRSPDNRGLYRAITEGVASALRQSDTIIVVEDDLVVTEGFLDYMADALQSYAGDPAVGCVHGYALPIHGLPDYYFLRGGDCWGWATWRDRWDLFRADPVALLKELVDGNRLAEFMLSHGATSLAMLCRRAQGRNQSWAILWHASLFLANRLTLHPGTSMVFNIGNDGSGTHASATLRYAGSTDILGAPPFHAIAAVPDAAAARRVSAYMDGVDEDSLLGPLRIALKRLHATLRAKLLLRSLGRTAGNSAGKPHEVS